MQRITECARAAAQGVLAKSWRETGSDDPIGATPAGADGWVGYSGPPNTGYDHRLGPAGGRCGWRAGYSPRQPGPLGLDHQPGLGSSGPGLQPNHISPQGPDYGVPAGSQLPLMHVELSVLRARMLMR